MTSKAMRLGARRQPRPRLTAPPGVGVVAAGATLSRLEFMRLLKAHKVGGLKTVAALHGHLVLGLPKIDAARAAGINQSAITRALARMAAPLCASCGQPLPILTNQRKERQ